MRVITVDENNIVTSEKRVGNNYELQENEFVSNVGYLGQRRLENGTFVDVPVAPSNPEPSIEETILYETQYQTILLEMLSLGGM